MLILSEMEVLSKSTKPREVAITERLINITKARTNNVEKNPSLSSDFGVF